MMDETTPDTEDSTSEGKCRREASQKVPSAGGHPCPNFHDSGAADTNPGSDEVGDTLVNKQDPVRPLPAAEPGEVRAAAGPTSEVWAPPPCDAHETCVSPRKAGERGEGPPLAPPGWTWWVGLGRRKKKSKFWTERYLRPTDEFLALYGGERTKIRSRRELENYIQKYHPSVSVEAVMASFVWRVPALRTPMNSNMWIGRTASSVLDLLD